MFEVRWRTISFSSLYKLPQYLLGCLYSLKYMFFERPQLSRVPISTGNFDIVTVVFNEEMSLLRLQARSLALYIDKSFSGRIIIIINDIDVPGVTKAIRQWILPEYGPWVDRVMIVPFYRLGYGLDPWNGWVFQQTLKLAVSALIDKPFYVVLDAKNHAIKPLRPGMFVSSQGRAKQRLLEPSIRLPEHHAACASYFDFDTNRDTSLQSVPVLTPFVMHTQSVRDLIDYIQTRESRSLFAFFCSTRLMAEFLLYGFYLRRHKPDQVDVFHEDGPVLSLSLWPDDIGDLEASIETAAAKPDLPFFAINRVLLKQLHPSQMALVETFWRQHGLLASGETFLQIERQFK